MSMKLENRRAKYVNIVEEMRPDSEPLHQADETNFKTFDLVYRSLCTLLYNYVPMSGHPGGSISSGRIVSGLLFDSMKYDLTDPDREDADILSYAAGHKALGLYAMYALRDEIARIGAPHLLAKEIGDRMRLEDLLGFRRNPTTKTPLFLEHKAKALDGHPTPTVPFVRLATGASGVGVASSLGLAFAAMDYYGSNGPRVHVLEGEGGLTPGRVAEALAAAGTASLGNVVLHVDWNQASIDSDHVCRDDKGPGDYVQWTPMELLYLNDWNVVYVPDGMDFQQVLAAQRAALEMDNGQPTAVVYRTVKGWMYGIEGRASHGAGHKLCSAGFYQALDPLLQRTNGSLPRCDSNAQRCRSGQDDTVVEECFFEGLGVVRKALEQSDTAVNAMALRLSRARDRLNQIGRKPRDNAPNVEAVFEAARKSSGQVPESVRIEPGTTTTLRQQLARVLNHLNRESGGAFLCASADLMGSTSVNTVAEGFPDGFFNARTNPKSRLLSLGGICEDATAGILSGLSTFGRHIGLGSSYGAFIASLGHIAARLHAIGMQARHERSGKHYYPFFLVAAHAGLKTGEDGPTHADPQPLQLLSENFPKGAMITLTPWEPAEIWTLVMAALAKRPAVIAPFVTRPNEKVLDRKRMGLASATAAETGVYCLRSASGKGDGTVVLQGSGVTYAFVEETMPLLAKEGVDLHVYYVASAELFDMLVWEEQEAVFPEERAQEAMGITDFTLPTMYRFVRSNRGRWQTLHPFRKNRYPGSGRAEFVMREAGLDGQSQFEAILRYVKER